VTPLQDLTLREQAAAVGSGTADGAALVDEARRRIQLLDGPLRAVVATCDDDALAAELGAAKPGPLRGVPVGVKDMFSLPWYAPMDGTAVAYKRPGPGLSGVARRLRASGALGVFVTNMHQLGIGTTGHISAHGPGANPWNRDRCAGGSSGGSAAAVAARMIAGAVGTDAAGSVRIPASYCGITGLKPTFGSVPVDGYTGGYSTMSAIGPMTRDADDCLLLGEVLLGRSLAGSVPRGVRIGIPVGPLWDDVEPDVARSCRAAVRTLADDGATLIELALEGIEHVTFAAIVAAGADRLPQLTPDWLKEVFPTLHPTVRGVIKSRLALSANTAHRVGRFRILLRRQLAHTLRSVDVLAWPTVPATAPSIERPQVELRSGRTSPDIATVRHTGLANLTGIPSITVPCGVDRDGLPIGLSLHAGWGQEDLLLALARRYEDTSEREHVDRCPLRPPGGEGAA
jgi:aspartyl-tRNA(Asn)/glutamyl-tRNA(Gln) amidotransferase subunit A